MSQIHALSDDQVGQELKKMTAFIKQEALEKAHEIKIKADEEFEIEKTKLVRQETDAIDASYEKKFKQATMSQQITRSTVANKTRLKVLAARQELLDDIFEAAESRLADLSAKDKKKYGETLKNLVLEGFYLLGEPDLVVRARKADYDLVRTAIEDAAKEYKEALGDDISGTLDEEHPVAEGSAGGVWIVGGSGKIEIDNTFEARLQLLKENALPAVRKTLFGTNPNRKFFD
ncbi:ATPase, V1/A1 complex, subunit E [Coniochaeta ligniaria NRRL 30616]|uniref:ATPase, V1/A1 complex, subunit E n=1 Tax=Coniochaeta ligniaria NRRL 30616 TaxID=1408157 RepID=A0A1J7JCG4_9PEZI|nr:ATPase, V1/A1 complex, subunit E [Coniochaeta ligniaria NRRL 30616]